MDYEPPQWTCHQQNSAALVGLDCHEDVNHSDAFRTFFKEGAPAVFLSSSMLGSSSPGDKVDDATRAVPARAALATSGGGSLGRIFAQLRTEICRITHELEGKTLERVLALKTDIQNLELLVMSPGTIDATTAEETASVGGIDVGLVGARLGLFCVSPGSICVRPVVGSFSTWDPATIPLQVGITPMDSCRVVTHTPRGLVEEEWAEALCIPLELEQYNAFAVLNPVRYVSGNEIHTALGNAMYEAVAGGAEGAARRRQSTEIYERPPWFMYTPKVALNTFVQQRLPKAAHLGRGAPMAAPMTATVAGTPYDLDRFNSVSFVVTVEAVNACRWKMTVTRLSQSLVQVASAIGAGGKSSLEWQGPQCHVTVKKHSFSTVAHDIRDALAHVFPNLNSQLWKLSFKFV